MLRIVFRTTFRRLNGTNVRNFLRLSRLYHHSQELIIEYKNIYFDIDQIQLSLFNKTNAFFASIVCPRNWGTIWQTLQETWCLLNQLPSSLWLTFLSASFLTFLCASFLLLIEYMEKHGLNERILVFIVLV